MKISHSVYSGFSNSELNWLPMDTEELYQTHLQIPEKRSLLEKYNWLNSKFTYKFNSEGFRSREFLNEPAIAFFGCSFTLGVGLPLETSWPYIVSSRLNLACYNLAIAGSSNDTAFRMAYSRLETIKPKMVIFCQTYSHRFEIFDGIGFSGKGPHGDNGNYENEWMAYSQNTLLNKEKNRLGMNQLCTDLGIKFLATEVEKLEIVDLARDLYHPGIGSNRKFADYILSLI